MIKPNKKEIKELRSVNSLTQTEFGKITYNKLRTVQQWESGERNMNKLTWEFLLIYFKKIKPRFFKIN